MMVIKPAPAPTLLPSDQHWLHISTSPHNNRWWCIEHAAECNIEDDPPFCCHDDEFAGGDMRGVYEYVVRLAEGWYLLEFIPAAYLFPAGVSE